MTLIQNRQVSIFVIIVLCDFVNATGSYQTTAGDLCGFSQSTAHRFVHKVSCAIIVIIILYLCYCTFRCTYTSQYKKLLKQVIVKKQKIYQSQQYLNKIQNKYVAEV